MPRLTASFAALLWVSDAFAAEDGTAQPKPQASRDRDLPRLWRGALHQRDPDRAQSLAAGHLRNLAAVPAVAALRPAAAGRAGDQLQLGRGKPDAASVGAVGSPEMQQRFIEISYEITVRFDDGRYGMIEQADPGDLRVGDRVRLVKGRVERWQ